MDRAPFDIGEQVFDREDDDPDTAVVTTTPEIPAEDWDIPHLERTVAEDNPDYPNDAPITFVLFENQIDSHFPDWDLENPLTIDALLEAETTFYTFPHQRLESLNPDETEAEDADESEDTEQSEDTTESDTEPEDESDPEPPAEVRDLKETLADRGLSAEIEADGQTITAEKLGVTYRVQPGEVIDGDGPHRDKIEEIAVEA
jgi:hypothetical protein